MLKGKDMARIKKLDPESHARKPKELETLHLTIKKDKRVHTFVLLIN